MKIFVNIINLLTILFSVIGIIGVIMLFFAFKKSFARLTKIQKTSLFLTIVGTIGSVIVGCITGLLVALN